MKKAMILLVTPHEEVRNCTPRFEEAIGDRLEVAESLRLAAARLRSSEYSVVVIDQSLVDAEPAEAEAVLQHAGMAIPIQMNFALSDESRVIREVKAAAGRRQREERILQQAAQKALSSELREPLTAMLLSCELAMEVPNLPAAAVDQIKSVHRLARTLKTRLNGA
jgi:signal transduction histidine kinase